MWLSVDNTVTFVGSIFIMAEFSTTSTYLVKDMQMCLGIVLPVIINQVSVERALAAKLLVGIRHYNTPISFRS